MIKKILISSVLIGSMTLISGCSTTHSGAGGQTIDQAGNMGMTTSGLGSQSGWQSMNNPNRLKAPYNQAYYFDFDSNTVHSDDYASIDVQANYLVEHPNAKVLLAGNTDIRGSREYNIALGERRDVSVANRLLSQGVRSNQIKKVSYGSEKPVALGHDESSYAKNRRVDLTYLAK